MKKVINIFFCCILVCLVTLTLAKGHLPRRDLSLGIKIVTVALIVYLFLRIILLFQNSRQRKREMMAQSVTPTPASGIQKAGTIILFGSIFGSLAAALLLLFHHRPAGRMVLTVSLASALIGLALLLFFPRKLVEQNSPSPKLRVLSLLLYGGIAATMIGEILKINHYPFGQPVFFCGLAILIITMLYSRNVRKKEIT